VFATRAFLEPLGAVIAPVALDGLTLFAGEGQHIVLVIDSLLVIRHTDGQCVASALIVKPDRAEAPHFELVLAVKESFDSLINGISDTLTAELREREEGTLHTIGVILEANFGKGLEEVGLPTDAVGVVLDFSVLLGELLLFKEGILVRRLDGEGHSWIVCLFGCLLIIKKSQSIFIWFGCCIHIPNKNKGCPLSL